MTQSLFGEATPDTPGLPMPPLRLRRIMLHGVGPDGARFDPLDLNFTTNDGAAARVLLSLTNTGGKSTLITLVCSLVVPASRAQVSGKVLGDYVLTGDTAHIVCEWEDTTANRRTVTGAVMEWKDGRRQPAHALRSTTNLHRAWYLFHTGPGLPGLDDLPFVVDGRRVPYRDFHAAVDDLITANPSAEGILTDKQQAWTNALEERTSVDPTLFGYQMRMNDSEAGAEKLLSSFDSPDHVVRFFVGALNDQRELETFTGKLEAYAQLAAQREKLEALAGFGVEITPRIELIAGRAAEAETAARLAERARADGGEHAAALDNRIEQDSRTLVELQAAVQTATGEANKARRAYGQISDIRLQLVLEDSRARVAATTARVERAEITAAETRRQEQAWQAVDPVIDLMAARVERDAAEAAYAAADAGLGPLRTQVTHAAALTAGRLEALIRETTQTADQEAAKAEEATSGIGQARDHETAAAVQMAEAAGELRGINELTCKTEQQLAEALAEGWCAEGESADACLRRWQDARGDANQQAEQAGQRAESAETAFDELGKLLEELGTALIGLRAAAGDAATKLGRHGDDFTVVEENDTVRQLLGAPPIDSPAVHRVIGMADSAARAADRRAVEHEATASSAREEIAHLDETGTAPTGPDVLAVLAILVEARIGAVTGLSWIERNIIDPADRAEYIVGNPELAGGVIISDPKRFGDGVEVLTTSEVRTKTPVLVTTIPSSGTASLIPEAERHIVVPHRATWDHRWAEQARSVLEETASATGQSAREAAEAAARYRDASALCAAFVRAWHDQSRDDLAHTADDAATVVATAEQRVADETCKRADRRRIARTARKERDVHLAAGRTANSHVQQAQLLVAAMSAADAAAARVSGLNRMHDKARETRQAAKDTADQASRAFDNATRAEAGYRSAVDVWSQERGDMGVDEAAPDPGGNLAVLKTSWRALRDELATAEHGMVEAELLDRARRAVSRAGERLRSYSEDVLAAADVLATTGEASAPATRVAAQQRARQSSDGARAELVAAEGARTEADRKLVEAQPAGDHQNHFDLSTTPWAPSTPADIPRLLEQLEIHNVELRELRDAADRAEAEAIEFKDSVEGDITSFSDTSGLWVSDRLATARTFTGTATAARELMRSYIKTHQETDGAAGKARELLHDAVGQARAVANSPQWAQLDSPSAVRIRALAEPDLVVEVDRLTNRIRAMTESAAADLRVLDHHRSILRDSLLSLCRDQRRLLREVWRSSRLPDGLGDLSHQPAIKIRFDDAPDDEAAARLAHRIDTWAVELTGNPKRAKSAEVRTRWLADAVRDTVLDRARAGPWSIEILKPRIDGRVLYCPPDRIPVEFSGGQVLTLAVLVYCALSRVRAAHRLGGARPAGTLLLDNPFGTASAEALIEMQHRLAAHSGVQLVCATGLHDPAVDAAFTGHGSVIMKLRNDGDLRRNLSYLRLRATVVDGIDVIDSITAGRDPSSAQNWVDSTRYEIRR
jgi:hypothetical protein